jgi:hypothetical protein
MRRVNSKQEQLEISNFFLVSIVPISTIFRMSGWVRIDFYSILKISKR